MKASRAMRAASILLTVAGLTGALSFGAGADDLSGLKQTTPKQRADYQTELMKGLLDLAPSQVDAVQAVNLEYAEQLDPILKGSASKFERMRKGRHILGEKDAAMKKTLPPAQYQKYLDTKDTVQKQLEEKFAAPAEAG